VSCLDARDAPLVCKPQHLLAEIDILMLQPELPGGIVTSGATSTTG
jgi:hypothetical protein